MNNKILQLANTEAGRFLLKEKSGFPIVRVTGSSYHMLTDRIKDKYIIRSVFFTHNRLHDIFGIPLTKMEIAGVSGYEAFLHFADLIPSKKLPSLYLTAFNTNSGGDGRVFASSTVWATARNASSGTADNNYYVGAELAGSTYHIHRNFLPYDTSSLDDSATITAADITGTPSDVNDADNDGNDYITIVQNTMNDPTSLVGGDYDQVGTSEAIDSGQRKDLTGLSGSQTFTFNATGIGFISLTGYTKLSMRGGHDMNNHAPQSGQTYCTWGSAPVLNVTVAAAAVGQVMWWN